jgi:hypothetical protein
VNAAHTGAFIVRRKNLFFFLNTITVFRLQDTAFATVFAPELLIAIRVMTILDDVLASTASTFVYNRFCYHMPRLSHFTYFEPLPKVLAKMSGGKNAGLFEITQWDPPQRYSYKSISGLPFPIESIESAVTFAPKENGTQITFESKFGLVGILRFAEGMFSKLATKGDGDNFDTAKRLLEEN